MRTVSGLLLVSMLLLIPAVSYPAATERFRAKLSGSQEVPSVKSPAKGILRLALSADGLVFQLNVDNITSPTAANIHSGKKGENGPPVAGIFFDPKVGRFSGILANGVITDQSLVGELQGKKVSDLVQLLRSGRAYLNVITTTYPGGEIRGQIKKTVFLP